MQLRNHTDAGSTLAVDRDDGLDPDLEVLPTQSTPGSMVPVVWRSRPAKFETGVWSDASTIGIK